MTHLSLLARTTCLLILATTTSAWRMPEDDAWPRQIDTTRASIVFYQPQPEAFEGNELRGRAAVAVTMTGESEPVFGVVWMKARVETDRSERTAEIVDIDVERMRFPESTEEDQQKLAEILEAEIPRWGMQISIDELLTSLETADVAAKAAEELQTEPPKILVYDSPAVLIQLHGPPQLQSIEGTRLMRVVNTPYVIALDTQAKRYYLDGGTIWYAAEAIEGPWTTVDSVPSEVAALRQPPPDEEVPPEDVGEVEGPAPEIVVATEPTELVVSQGAPTWSPVEGCDLLYMKNSESDVLLEIGSQKNFILLSGRWFTSDSLQGPWAYVASDALPDDFGKISADSDLAHLRAFVAGTEEAQDAVYDAQIPQTSAIDRKTAALEVTYDGDPEFEVAEGTEVRYAVNTSSAVFQVGNKFYACDQAVWFVADTPNGPWVVSDEVPEVIYTIPPSCPHYNVRYVYVYGATPTVVYVGYLPGYCGSYVYGSTIVYGTGYYYRPWYGRYYYARPATWGFHVRYNPWTGWSFGLSYTAGPFRISIGVGRGWWGPRGWRGYHRGYRHGYRRGYRAGARAGYRAGRRTAHRQSNMYQNKRNASRNAPRTQGQRNQRAKTASGRSNNVYADRSGNVHRKTDGGGWESRQSGSWQRSEATPGGGAPSDRTRQSTGAHQTPSQRAIEQGQKQQAQGGQRPTASTGGRQTSTSGGSRSGTSGSSASYRSSASQSRSGLNRDAGARSRGSSRSSVSRGGGGVRRAG